MEIAATYLEGIASQWYQENEDIIRYWNNESRPQQSFVAKLIDRFTTTSLLNKWQLDYRNCKQQTDEDIETYNVRFSKALNRVESVNQLPMQMKIMDYIGGLAVDIAVIVSGSNPTTLH